ncbi:50S ribosome-binding GTPase [Achromobacter sp. ES-001]|uniref:YcjF family protein n=1 Tax=Achromobacter sp. ES-001 TaxID=2860286 RepID=UPI001C640CE4|nr:GTPase [Achromobacter sp. ES-001]QYJ21057.1 50S ribosome-binding GTPase [Achromobacter sp. ES-001]
MQNLDDLLKEAIQKATTERGHINILIAGRSGVGKSTLINAVFQKNLAETGQGRPVTQNTREISRDGVPITIFDTRGLEMSQFRETLSELEKVIKDRSNEKDSNRHIHAAWLCIQEDGRRVESAEVDLHNMLAQHVPLITVITKARSDNGFKNEVIRLLPESRNVIRVRAIREELDDGYMIDPMGLDRLIELTSEVIPEGKRKALAAAQKANLNYKKLQAHKIVAGAATAAAAAGASPIPFSDAAILAPIQIGMVAGITSVFGLELSKGTLSTLVTSAIGVGGATFVGRTIVVNVLKFFPGVGTIAGGAISAATASAITIGLGEAYIAVLAEIFSEDPDAIPTAANLADRLKDKMNG